MDGFARRCSPMHSPLSRATYSEEVGAVVACLGQCAGQSGTHIVPTQSSRNRLISSWIHGISMAVLLSCAIVSPASRMAAVWLLCAPPPGFPTPRIRQRRQRCRLERQQQSWQQQRHGAPSQVGHCMLVCRIGGTLHPRPEPRLWVVSTEREREIKSRTRESKKESTARTPPPPRHPH